MLKLDELRHTALQSQPFPYLVVPQIIKAEFLPELISNLPEIRHPGSFPVAEANGGPLFQTLIDELESDTMRQIIAEKFQVDLNGLPLFTTLRGVMRRKDGAIHCDSKTKVIALLLYLNESWEQPGGRLRMLRGGKDMNDYVEEIAPTLGRLVAFKVTDNCWHGHLPVEGKRLSIQMHYLVGIGAKGKHQFFHTLSAKLKKGLG